MCTSYRYDPMRQRPPVTLSRRRLLAATATAAIAGCLGDTDEPAPVDIGDDAVCDQCGMVIATQPGPVGQAWFDGDAPEGRDGPAWFCSSTCTYQYVFDREADGIDATVVYLTDYSAVDWSTSAEDGVAFISAHLGADDVGRAPDLHLVANSDLRGSMGPDLIGFSGEGDVDEFMAEYGGTSYRHDEVTPALIASLSA